MKKLVLMGGALLILAAPALAGSVKHKGLGILAARGHSHLLEAKGLRSGGD